MANVVVTKEWLKVKIEENPGRTVGRALVAIFRRQTDDEKSTNGTQWKNGMGFSANDARMGSIGAKYYLKSGTLPEWVLKHWTKPGAEGLPKIVKYAKQLNLVANENN